MFEPGLGSNIKAESLVALLIKFIEEDNGVFGGGGGLFDPPPPLGRSRVRIFCFICKLEPLKGANGSRATEQKIPLINSISCSSL